MALIVIRAERKEREDDEVHWFMSFCHIIESARTFQVMGGWSSHKAIWFTRPVKIVNRWWD